MTPEPPFRRAVVVGTGRMAPGLGAALAAAGCDVTIVGRVPGRARLAADAAAQLAGREVAASGIDAEALSGADLVVENIVEDLAAKQGLLQRIEPWLDEAAVVASNTSSLRVGDMAEGLQRPERLAALHFLFPAHRSPLVEVMPGPATDPAVLEQLVELVLAMGACRSASAWTARAWSGTASRSRCCGRRCRCWRMGWPTRRPSTPAWSSASRGAGSPRGRDDRGARRPRHVLARVRCPLPGPGRRDRAAGRLRTGVRPMDDAARAAATRLREQALIVTEPIAEARRALLKD